MNEEKRFGAAGANRGSDEAEDKQRSTSSSRARNRTVMLTPEMTGQVRAMLYQEPEEEQSRNPLTDLLPPLDWGRAEGKAEPGYDNGSAEEHSEDYGKDLASDPKANRSGSTSKIEPPHFGQTLESKPEPAISHPPFGGGLGVLSGAQEHRETRETPRELQREPREQPRPDTRAGGTESSRKATTGLFAMGAGAGPQNAGMMSTQSGTVGGRGMQVPVGQQVKTQASPGVSFRVNAPAEQPKGAPMAAPPVTPQKVPATKVVGFLVSYDKDQNGEVYEIRAGRWLLTSRPTDHGDYILVNDDTISPLHAIVRATKEGKIQVLDQLSEFGTGVMRAGQSEEEEVAGAMVGVEHGDTIRFGERFFMVVTIPAVKRAAAASNGE